MEEVSNRILGVLILVAMCVSLAGTFATFSLIRVVEEVPVTGLYSGITNVTVVRFAALDVLVALVEFNDMVQDSTNETSDYSPHPFVIENNGTTFLNITIWADNLWPASKNFENDHYRFNASDDNATDTALSVLQSGEVTAWSNMSISSGTAKTLATCINNSDDADSINVHINITVPTAATAGTHTSTVTFGAVDPGQNVCGAGT